MDPSWPSGQLLVKGLALHCTWICSWIRIFTAILAAFESSCPAWSAFHIEFSHVVGSLHELVSCVRLMFDSGPASYSPLGPYGQFPVVGLASRFTWTSMCHALHSPLELMSWHRILKGIHVMFSVWLALFMTLFPTSADVVASSIYGIVMPFIPH